MPKQAAPEYITVDQAAQMLGLSTRRVLRMINEKPRQGGQPPFPGAHKLETGKRTSPYVIPYSEVEAEKQRRQAKHSA